MRQMSYFTRKKRLLCAIALSKADLQLPMFDFSPLEAIITVSKDSAISKHPCLVVKLCLNFLRPHGL